MRIFAAIGHDPAQILSRVAATSTGLLNGLLATCLVAHVAPNGDGDWTITVANAGHVPPVVVDPNGTARLIDIAHDPLIGVPALAGDRRTNTVLTATSGCTLVLYTDGMIEQRREAIDDSIARVVTAVAEIGNGPIVGLSGRLVAALRPDGRDDIACIALRF